MRGSIDPVDTASRKLPRQRQAWVLAATILASSMAFIEHRGQRRAAGAAAALGASLAEVQWVVEAYALFLPALMLVGGALGDRFGRRRVFLVGVAVFAAASAWCGFARGTHELILARALQGIGAALLVPGSLAIISATFDEPSAAARSGPGRASPRSPPPSGPVLGGWLIEHVSLARGVLPQRAARRRGARAVRCCTCRKPRPATEGRDSTGSAPLLATLGLGGVTLR